MVSFAGICGAQRICWLAQIIHIAQHWLVNDVQHRTASLIKFDADNHAWRCIPTQLNQLLWCYLSIRCCLRACVFLEAVNMWTKHNMVWVQCFTVNWLSTRRYFSLVVRIPSTIDPSDLLFFRNTQVHFHRIKELSKELMVTSSNLPLKIDLKILSTRPFWRWYRNNPGYTLKLNHILQVRRREHGMIIEHNHPGVKVLARTEAVVSRQLLTNRPPYWPWHLMGSTAQVVRVVSGVTNANLTIYRPPNRVLGTAPWPFYCPAALMAPKK